MKRAFRLLRLLAIGALLGAGTWGAITDAHAATCPITVLYAAPAAVVLGLATLGVLAITIDEIWMWLDKGAA